MRREEERRRYLVKGGRWEFPASNVSYRLNDIDKSDERRDQSANRRSRRPNNHHRADRALARQRRSGAQAGAARDAADHGAAATARATPGVRPGRLRQSLPEPAQGFRNGHRLAPRQARRPRGLDGGTDLVGGDHVVEYIICCACNKQNERDCARAFARELANEHRKISGQQYRPAIVGRPPITPVAGCKQCRPDHEETLIFTRLLGYTVPTTGFKSLYYLRPPQKPQSTPRIWVASAIDLGACSGRWNVRDDSGNTG